METVYVINKDGTPLMPTTRMRHVRYLLNKGKARIVSKKPYVIQLKYQSEGITQPLYGGTDVGRTNIGNAVIREDGTVVYQDHVETRNKDIPDFMKERAGHRRQSRAGERKGLQRMAVKHKTVQQGRVRERKLPGCEKPITLHEIVNDEARFANRIRPDGWLTPTANQLVRTHTQCVKNICKILPVTHWAYEWNRFAFMRMEDGSVYGTDFQNGRLKGYASVNDYIYARREENVTVVIILSNTIIMSYQEVKAAPTPQTIRLVYVRAVIIRFTKERSHLQQMESERNTMHSVF